MSVTYPTNWMADDGKTVLRGLLTIHDDGRANVDGVQINEIGRPSANGRATSGKCVPNKPEPAKPCRACGASRAVFWLGLLWIGVPWFRKPFGRTKQDGCGCLALPKLLWLHLRYAIAEYRKLRADTMAQRGHG